MRTGSPILASRLPHNVVLLGFVSLFTDFSSEMLYPIVPLFLTSTLGAPVAMVGIIEGVAETVASLLKVASGWWSDRLGRRKLFVLLGYTLSALSRPMLAAAYGWGAVLFARVLDRFGKGVRGAPRDALIADSTPPEIRGRAFGLHRSMDQFGAVIGPVAGLALLTWLSAGYRVLFLVAFIPALLSAALVLLVREPARELRRSAAPPLSVRTMPSRLKWFLLALAVFALGNSSDVFLILRARDLGFSDRAAVGLFALFNTVYVLTAYPAGVLSDRLPRLRLFAAGLVVFAAVYAGFALVSQRHWLWLLFPVYGAYMGLTDGVSRALVVDLVGPGQRATALGLHAATLGFAALPASAAAGLLWQSIGPAAPFWYGAAMALLSAALVLLPRAARC